MERRRVVEAITQDTRVAKLISILESFEAATPKGEDSRLATLELLTTADHPFARHADIHHITASAFVFSDRGVLLHKHKLSGDWIQPGGHVDGDEWPSDSAQREAIEETGIEASHPAGGPRLIGVDVHVTVNNHVHYDLQYLLEAEPADPAPPAGESPEVEWMSIDEALLRTDNVCRNVITRVAALR